MDWEGFALSVRQTIESVIFYIVIEDIFSFILNFRFGRIVSKFLTKPGPTFDEFHDYLLLLANPKFLSKVISYIVECRTRIIQLYQ